MEYYYQIKEPSAFRYGVMNNVKECLLVQREQEKLELIRQAKKDLFKEIKDNVKEIKTLITKLDSIMMDDNIKREIKSDLQKRAEEEKISQIQEEALEAIKAEAEVVEKPIVLKKDSSKKGKPKEEPKPAPRKEFSVSKSEETNSFEYTLDQIEKKLSELKSS